MLTTTCWRRGGVCINYMLCPSYRQLTEVPGCKNRFNVCCLVWNQYEVRDLKDKGIGNIAFPWSIQQQEFKGEGVVQVTPKIHKKRKKKNTTETHTSTLFLLRNILL